MHVQFYDHKEFLRELQIERNHFRVCDNIVRLTKTTKQTKTPPIMAISVSSSFAVSTGGPGDKSNGKMLIRLDEYCGDMLGNQEADQEVIQKVKDITRCIQKQVKEVLQLDLRSGNIRA